MALSVPTPVELNQDERIGTNRVDDTTFFDADPVKSTDGEQGEETEKVLTLNDQKEFPVLSRRNTSQSGSGTLADDENTAPQHQRLKDLSDVDALVALGKKRDKWYQLWRPKNGPPRPPPSLDDVAEIPLATASLLSQLTYAWVTPLMVLGYQRPLMATDLWKMDKSREASLLGNRFAAAYRKREIFAKEYNARLIDPMKPLPPSRYRKLKWRLQLAIHPRRYRASGLPTNKMSAGSVTPTRGRNLQALEEEWRSGSGKRKASITMALNDTMSGFWAGGLYKVLGDTAQLMAPLLTKALINFSKEAYSARAQGTNGPNIGRGIGYAIGLFFLTILASFFFRSMASGVMARAALISATFRRSMVLTTRARAQHPADPADCDDDLAFGAGKKSPCVQRLAYHASPESSLFYQLGPSALVGMSLFVLLTPLQTWFMKLSVQVRQSSMLLQELLSSMAIIKQFTYELPFLKRLASLRGKELKGVRSIMIIRAANQALAFSIPVLASVVSFAAYILGGGHEVDPATAVQRLGEFFEADTSSHEIVINPGLEVAIKVENATFEWVVGEEALQAESKKEIKKKNADSIVESPQQAFSNPFRLDNLNFVVPKGQLVAIIGPIGSGKSSLLQGLIGEMNQVSGKVSFSGSLGYCQQNAWIQNLTVRENILFGKQYEEDRYWRAVKAAALPSDLELFADGDMTEIGERGVNLSGGQKSRLNIARALYSNADIILLDDPLSAVDAHVGLHLFEEAILGLKESGKTVVLVTHALHMLAKGVDYIYSLEAGKIVEEGTYSELIRLDGAFKRLDQKAFEEGTRPTEQKITKKMMGSAAGVGKLEGRLMKGEVRKTGSVGSKVYMQYLRAGEAGITAPLTLVAAILMQGCNILSMLWITYWQNDQFNRSPNFYMGIYAVLGIGQAFFTFALGATIGILSYFASRSLYSSSLRRLFHTPMSFLSTTPVGRIMSVYGKDIDTIDSNLSDSFRMFLLTVASVIGSVVIITVYLHYFLPIVAVVMCGYLYFANFYRATAREVKRLDSILRSLLYSHFGESLSGISTIRAYNATERFAEANDRYVDLEDRAYLLTTANQRWLAIRLDFCGAILIFCVAIMAAASTNLQPSVVGLTLTYLTTLVQAFGMMTRQSAELENNMNAVERVLYYSSDQLPQERDHVIESSQPLASWPEAGEIIFKNVVMSYRKDLPPVLNGINLHVEPGSKVGIIGRTGAGKSSLTQVLFRLVELQSGSIEIDGVDISTLGLSLLRSRLSLIPQEPLLFSGTIRSNLDPFDQYSDAHLLDAMRKATLVGNTRVDEQPVSGTVQKGRFHLDTPIESEGQNLSVGERALLSLARALVKDSQITILDEATASTDAATDAKIQETIRREFGDKTILCIAHRLRTILSFDRILVMDAGTCREFAAPLELFCKADSLFRSLCLKSDITLEDIQNAQAQAKEDRARRVDSSCTDIV
ncbi:hypothetical protein QFC22_002384 [Naganishia vaughanmartiniae]|uniref:Uncharacterized protein n=1 Tax=Naganishia vaughanmartiniae TaxID=1424756 RepID=A0ACC2XCV0_9TREE|nr:hypothetical protein QFC22_002384 [Naganishia vaughanmartiniae]